jgi:hypothetical protein
MTKISTDWQPRRLPKRHQTRSITDAEKAFLKAESATRYQKARAIFERVRPQLIEEHYNWYIAIAPDSDDYFIEEDYMTVFQKLQQLPSKGKVVIFRLNETGTCGNV